MTKLLAIETSSDACSIVVSVEDRVSSFHEVIPQQHSKKIIGILKKLMLSAGLNFHELDAIAIGCGPGSFTGIRLGCMVAQGLSFSSGIPTIRVSSLEIMSEHFFKNYQAKDVVTLLNAHMKQIYIGRFKYNKKELSSYSQMSKYVEEFDISEFTSDTFFVGGGCELVKDKLKGLNSLIYPHYPNALDLLSIAKKKFLQGETVGPEELLPIYISGEEHWQKA